MFHDARSQEPKTPVILVADVKFPAFMWSENFEKKKKPENSSHLTGITSVDHKFFMLIIHALERNF